MPRLRGFMASKFKSSHAVKAGGAGIRRGNFTHRACLHRASLRCGENGGHATVRGHSPARCNTSARVAGAIRNPSSCSCLGGGATAGTRPSRFARKITPSVPVIRRPSLRAWASQGRRPSGTAHRRTPASAICALSLPRRGNGLAGMKLTSLPKRFAHVALALASLIFTLRHQPAAAADGSAASAGSVTLVGDGASASFRAVTSHLELGARSFEYSETGGVKMLVSFLDEIIKSLPERERKDFPRGSRLQSCSKFSASIPSRPPARVRAHGATARFTRAPSPTHRRGGRACSRSVAVPRRSSCCSISRRRTRTSRWSFPST